MKSTEKYISNYSSLPSASSKKVVVSFTTTPDMLNKIEPMIKSLLDQTVKVDMISMYIPYKYNGKSYGNIPEYLKKVVNVFRHSKDYGIECNLIPVLHREKDCDTIIIAVKDNYVYGHNFIKKMVSEVNNSKGKVVHDEKNTSYAFTPKSFGCKLDNNIISNAKYGTLSIPYLLNYKCM